jgi:hypothetical protein
MLNDFIKAREENKVHLEKGLLPNTPQWIDFLNLMTKKYNKSDKIPYDDTWRIKSEDRWIDGTDIMIYNKMDPVIFKAVEYYSEGNYGDNLIDASAMIDLFAPIFPRFEIKAILNLIGSESEYWVHKDNHEVISWHCQGKMEWRIYHSEAENELWKQEKNMKIEAPYDSYILEPGDVIYVPIGTIHEVVAPEPRASLILQANAID